MASPWTKSVKRPLSLLKRSHSAGRSGPWRMLEPASDGAHLEKGARRVARGLLAGPRLVEARNFRLEHRDALIELLDREGRQILSEFVGPRFRTERLVGERVNGHGHP